MYYKLPINLGGIMHGSDASTNSLTDNIAQHLQILLTTKMGENRFNENYGNRLWNMEFDNGISEATWDAVCKEAIMESIKANEPRIKDVEVTIHAKFIEKAWPLKKFTEVKKQVIVFVKATLTDTNEIFTFKSTLYISPMSVD